MILGQRFKDLAAKFQIRSHELIAGVAQATGGGDEGPNPHELLQASLAACTVITVQMFANRKQWKLDSADVYVQIDSEDKTGSQITRRITLRGDLTDEQRTRLLEIAEKCPIHNLLSRPTVIATTLDPA